MLANVKGSGTRTIRQPSKNSRCPGSHSASSNWSDVPWTRPRIWIRGRVAWRMTRRRESPMPTAIPIFRFQKMVEMKMRDISSSSEYPRMRMKKKRSSGISSRRE